MEKSPVISESGSGGRGEIRVWGDGMCALCILECCRHLEPQVWESPPKPFTPTSLFGLVIMKTTIGQSHRVFKKITPIHRQSLRVPESLPSGSRLGARSRGLPTTPTYW